MIVEQTVYIQQLQRQLIRERKRTEAYAQTVTIFPVACGTLVCLLATYCNIL